jgi:3',5'-cyclic AMP phosphodiesterase CpdA
MRLVAHISDIHFGRDQPAITEAVIADILAAKPDILVNSGDFTQRARRRQYAHARDFMAKLPTPQICVPGNHDIPLYDVIRRFFYPLNRYRQYITKDLRPFYKDEQLAILGMNTARSWTWSWNGFWKDGRISEEQLLDIKLRFCDLPPETFKIVVTHHPFIPPPKERPHGIVGGAFAALDMMEDCGLDMVLAGHLHMGYSGDVRTHHEGIKRSIISVQAGTAISNRRRGNEPNAYNLITINPPQLTITVRAWNGTKFDTHVETHYTRIEGIWQREG